MTTFSLLWLPDVLRAAGLTVIETPGWQSRGHGDVRNIRGVMCHHTCGPLHGDIDDLHVLVDGRSDLPGPLCELGLARSGTYHVVSAGKPWHAGNGNWQGVTDGNGQMIGIEAENTGETSGPRADTWPEVQMDAYKRGVAAILQHIGAKPIMCCGHKEYALPKGRKDDPNFDMGAFRNDVAKIMGQQVDEYPKEVTVLVDGLNVREKDSSTSKVLRSLKKGDKVTVTGLTKNADTAWLSLQTVDGGGFIAKYYTA